MGKRLYVGSLPFETTEDQLREAFAPHGQVVGAKVIVDKLSGKSKGFGFVEMGTDAEAQAAIQKMNGATLGARRIVVNEARPMEDRPRGGNPGGGFGGGGFGNGPYGGRRDGNRKRGGGGSGNRW